MNVLGYAMELEEKEVKQVETEEYRTETEARYFGSDLNKFIHYNCTPQMDTINIDCLQYKASSPQLRFIEYKHEDEELSKRQKRLLPMMAQKLQFRYGEHQWPSNVYTIYGNPPFNHVWIVDMLTRREVEIKDIEHLKRWLNFEIEL